MKLFRNLLIIIIFSVLLLVYPKNIKAQTLNFTCSNRFVTLVNPVRGRSFWFDKSLKPIEDQYSLIKSADFAASWLLQYETLTDSQLIEYIKSFDSKQELGVFLEVTPPLTNKVKIVYPYAVAWANPKAIFLSGYSRGERRQLIDEIFKTFKEIFGKYPKSVGAWWIDSYSLNYMVSRYKINSALIVADQKTTDHYGVWGQWWGVPYYPSRLNILVPPQNIDQKLDVVVTQWAQRDFLQAIGEGYVFSNYSLQANDYLGKGKNTSYFADLIAQYSDCRNPISQVTVGLETGIESVANIDEYRNQIDLLHRSTELQMVTLSDFYKSFKQTYPYIFDGYYLGSGDKVWILTVGMRENKFLGDKIIYPSDIPFADYFIKDSSDFLRRYVPDLTVFKVTKWFPYWIFIFIGLMFLFTKKINWKQTFLFGVFIFLSYHFIFLSFEKYGWSVFFGPQLQNLKLIQLTLILFPMIIFWGCYSLIKHKQNLNKLIIFLPLTFAFDYFISIFKFSLLNGFYYFGFFWQKTIFLGIKLSDKLSYISLIKQDFEIGPASNFLSWSTNKLFTRPVLWLIVYPLFHLLIAFILFKIYQRLNSGMKKVIIVVLIVFLAGFVYSLTKIEPRLVLPILKQ